jgi:hypothetical protein
MGRNMHTDIGIQPSVSSLATHIQGRISLFGTKMRRWITSLVQKAKKGIISNLSANRIRNAILPVAVLGGAGAFGFWQDSILAGLFACFVLFLLAGIYKALRQIAATLRWGCDHIIPAKSNWKSQSNFEIGAKAIEHLQPWVENETELTEESVKAYCSVLLDTLAALHPKFAE